MVTKISIATLVLTIMIGVSTAEETNLGGTWTLFIGEDEQSYESIASINQNSATTIKGENAADDVTPVLSFRCSPGKAEILASVDWNRFISSFNTEVGFKVDDGKRRWIKWGVDQSEKITLSRSAEDTRALLEQLSSGALLEVEVSPYSSSPVTANFELDGIDAALAELSTRCE